MDACEATKVVMARVQKLEPENASKIMGYILIQDDGDKEMIRLAFGADALLLSCINQVKARLGLSSNISSAKPSAALSSSGMPSNPFPPRIMIPNNTRPISYATVLNGSSAGENESSKTGGSSSLHFYGGKDFFDDSTMDPLMSPSGMSDSLIFPYGEDAHGVPSPHPHPFHRRSCSVNDAGFLSNLEEGGSGNGFGWRPCMYFARGFCKNGSSCKFLHSDDVGGCNGEMIEAGSPSPTTSGFDKFLRMKAIQQQPFAAVASRGHHSFPYCKSVNILNDNQRCGPRNGFSQMGLSAGLSSSSRQIYLTFPADSTFKEEDVSSYFSTFGPVQDVRIPYQPKRMFGFVTFVYPETVKLILAKGNPHYVCDSRVLVKPYKEKGRIPEKKQLQQQHEHSERGEYSACLSHSGVDPRELFDVPIGSRVLFNTQEMMLRRKLEQEAELQHVIGLQSRRIANLQLVEQENPQHCHRFLPRLFNGVPISSPRQQQLLRSQSFMDSPGASNRVVLQEFDGGVEASTPPADEKMIFSSKKDQQVNDDDFYLPESLEHILPDNLFASPTKSVAEQRSGFSAEADNNIHVTSKVTNNSPVVASSSPLRMASLFYSETASH